MQNKLYLGEACLVSNVSDEVALTFEDANIYEFLYTEGSGEHNVLYTTPEKEQGIVTRKYVVAVPQT